MERTIQVNAVLSICTFMSQMKLQISIPTQNKILAKSQQQIKSQDKGLSEIVIKLLVQLFTTQKSLKQKIDDLIQKCLSLLSAPFLTESTINAVSEFFILLCKKKKISEKILIG